MLCCKSMTDSDVRICNARLRRNEESEVGSYVRDFVLNLGVVSKEGRDKMLKDIKVMERRDKEGLIIRRAQKNQVL